MGLAISVGNPCIGSDGTVYDSEGVVDFRRRFEVLRDALAAEGITGWSEPDLPPPTYGDSFPYGWLHHLRRAYALVWDEQEVTPVRTRDDLDRSDGVVKDAASMFTSHLLCHSDAEGYYVPVRFEDPLFLSESIPGAGMVGSSYALLDELMRVAPAIGITPEEDGTIADAESIRSDDGRGDPFAIEQTVWLALYDACRASIRYGSAVVFT
jgi:hypothetical protein